MASQKQKNEKTIPPYVKAIAGSFGGTMEACCLQPIDVIKTRLQLDRSGSYKGIIHCGMTVCRTEGVRALWKGLTPFATHLTLKYALRMGSNAVLQSAFKDSNTGNLSPYGRVFSGFGAGVLEALVIVTPFEFTLLDVYSLHKWMVFYILKLVNHNVFPIVEHPLPFGMLAGS
ncbi:unnamed protein product [Ilex paraguariensis]|uniref:Uncharacterized protein n=1 Tax=Ilex paraguariensis TaxID=185542 RepID=A0ABC8S0Q8_9AQUA